MKPAPCQSLTIVAVACLLASACQQRSQPTGTMNSQDGSTLSGTGPAADGGMSAEDAVKLIQSLAKNGSLTTTVNTKYTETQTNQVPCGAMEVESEKSVNPHNPELWRCKSLDGNSYHKTATVTETKCCHTKPVPIPADVQWQASRSADDGKWHVSGDFALSAEQHHAVFVIDPETRQASELPH
ncbi:MAG: hypothetical protein ABI454_04780 [Sphingomicrobium sp.]